MGGPSGFFLTTEEDDEEVDLDADASPFGTTAVQGIYEAERRAQIRNVRAKIQQMDITKGNLSHGLRSDGTPMPQDGDKDSPSVAEEQRPMVKSASTGSGLLYRGLSLGGSAGPVGLGRLEEWELRGKSRGQLSTAPLPETAPRELPPIARHKHLRRDGSPRDGHP